MQDRQVLADVEYHRARHALLTNGACCRLECIYKYDLEVWDAIMKTFDALPVAAVVNGKSP